MPSALFLRSTACHHCHDTLFMQSLKHIMTSQWQHLRLWPLLRCNLILQWHRVSVLQCLRWSTGVPAVCVLPHLRLYSLALGVGLCGAVVASHVGPTPCTEAEPELSDLDKWEALKKAAVSEAATWFSTHYVALLHPIPPGASQRVGKGEMRENPLIVSFSPSQWWAERTAQWWAERAAPRPPPAVLAAVNRALAVLAETTNVERVLSTASAFNRLHLSDTAYSCRMFLKYVHPCRRCLKLWCASCSPTTPQPTITIPCLLCFVAG